MDRTRRGSRLIPLAVLVVLAVVVHWPAGAGFKADDYPAIAYASHAGNCLHDFAGPQYGLDFLVLFRPLITLSFGIDHALFGTEPFGYYAMNTAALAAAVVLLWSVLCRLCAPAVAFATVALWIAHPILVPSLRWVAGRVDTHATVLILLALVLHLGLRRGGKRWPVWLVALLALGTKESAIGLPLLALAIDFADPHPSYRPAPALFGRALPALPYLVLIPAFLVWRKLVLGTFVGGYRFLENADLDVAGTLGGLRTTLTESLAPMTGIAVLGWIVPLAVVAACVVWIGRGHTRARLAAVAFAAAGLYGPLVQQLPSMRSGDQRYAYLACAGVLIAWSGLAFVLARRRPLVTLIIGLAPLGLIWPAHTERRAGMDGHDAFNARVVAAVDTCSARLAPGQPVVIAGDAERLNDPYRFLWGLGALHKPPFRSQEREIVTLRALHEACVPVPAELAARGLAAHVVVGADTVAVVAGRPGARQAATPVAWTPPLRAADWPRVVDPEAGLGFADPATASRRVAVCTTVGSAMIDVTPRGGVLELRMVLAANLTKPGGGAYLPVLNVVPNAMDLAPSSPVFLLWQNGGVEARVDFTPSFTRAIITDLAR